MIKGARGLQKRIPVVDLTPGTRLYQLTCHGRLLQLDVHPASLSNDGVFVLLTPTTVFCHCGPKVCCFALTFCVFVVAQCGSGVSKLSPVFARLVARQRTGKREKTNAVVFCVVILNYIQASDGRTVYIADQDDQFWASFGARFKLTEATPKEVNDRYAAKFTVHVIHSDMRMTEEDARDLPQILKQPCHFVLDAKDDVYVWIAAEAPFLNKTVALAKADEVFNTDLQARPACASIVQVLAKKKMSFAFLKKKNCFSLKKMSEIDRVRNPVFEMIVRLLSDPALAQSVAESSAARPLSFSSDDMSLLKRESTGKTSEGAFVEICFLSFLLSSSLVKGVAGASVRSAAASKMSINLANAPARDWSTFECEREVDSQLEKVSFFFFFSWHKKLIFSKGWRAFVSAPGGECCGADDECCSRRRRCFGRCSSSHSSHRHEVAPRTARPNADDA